MPSVKLSIEWKDGNDKKGTTNITEINPEATNNDLIKFGQLLTDLTGNTYTGATKTVTTVLIESSKQDPQFTVSPTPVTAGEDSETPLPGIEEGEYRNSRYWTISYLGERREMTFSGQVPRQMSSATASIPMQSDDGTKLIMGYFTGWAQPSEAGDGQSGELTITLAGDDTYEQATAKIVFDGVGSENLVTLGG